MIVRLGVASPSPCFRARSLPLCLRAKSTEFRRFDLTTFPGRCARVSKSSRDPVVLVRQASWTVAHAKLESRLVQARERRSPVNLGAFRSRVYDET